MSLFDFGKDKDAKPLGIDTPNNTDDFRARENENTNEIEGMSLPSINKRKSSNKLVTILGFVLIAAAAAALIITVNKESPAQKQERLAKKQAQKTEKIANNLPPLDIPPPSAPAPLQSANATQAGAVVPPLDNNGLQGGVSRPIPLNTSNGMSNRAGNPNAKHEMTWYERKMSGGAPLKSTNGENPSSPAMAQRVKDDGQGIEREQPNNSELALRLTPTVTKGVSASLLPDRNMLITQGTKLACTLETAINTTLPGTTLCTLARDVYSTNGKVVLLDRGTRLVGQQQGSIKRGEARVFVLWTRAETPNGVVINLNSAGTDTLGRAGLEGWVDNHFWERFGAAIMMTMVKGTVDAVVASQKSGGSGFNVTGGGGDRVVERILQDTINIPPTLIKNQGDDVEVIVQRDLDFSKVYDLKVTE